MKDKSEYQYVSDAQILDQQVSPIDQSTVIEMEDFEEEEQIVEDVEHILGGLVDDVSSALFEQRYKIMKELYEVKKLLNLYQPHLSGRIVLYLVNDNEYSRKKGRLPSMCFYQQMYNVKMSSWYLVPRPMANISRRVMQSKGFEENYSHVVVLVKSGVELMKALGEVSRKIKAWKVFNSQLNRLIQDLGEPLLVMEQLQALAEVKNLHRLKESEKIRLEERRRRLAELNGPSAPLRRFGRKKKAASKGE